MKNFNWPLFACLVFSAAVWTVVGMEIVNAVSR